MPTPITFFSEGHKLVGDLYLPDGLKPGEQRAGIVLCHGYTGVKDLYLPDNARVLNEAGYVVLTFDYKGWGESEGTRNRLAPYSRVADVQAAITYLPAAAGQRGFRAHRHLRHQLWRCDGDLGGRSGSAGEVHCLLRRCRPWQPLDAERAPAG